MTDLGRDLADLQTPCLLLEVDIMDANIARVAGVAARHGVALRPHVKTPKSVEIGRRLTTGGCGITVSTLREAEGFARAGFRDMLYATTLAPQKAARMQALRAGGTDIVGVVDSLAGIAAIAAAAGDGPALPVLIELNLDDYRGGIRPDGGFDALAAALHASRAFELRGVMAYAGVSYDTAASDRGDLAERHRAGLVAAAARIEALGAPCPVRSFGSTPALLAAHDLRGVSEVRGGIYVFQDLFQAGIGACTIDDIALSVLATVIGHQPELNRLWIDAGGMALSKDRSTAGRPFDARYGLVAGVDGAREAPLWVQDVHQELGLVTRIDGASFDLSAYPIGSQLRVLPNHSDMTAAAYDSYHPIEGGRLAGEWARLNGW